MISPPSGTPAPITATDEAPPPEAPLPPTPWKWRIGIAGAVVVIATAAFVVYGQSSGAARPNVASRTQAAAGILCFLGVAAFFSKSLQSVRLKTLLWGIGLQFVLALVVLQPEWIHDVPGWLRLAWMPDFFETIGKGIKALIAASDKGADFVFGSLSQVDGPAGFVFAFKALPPIIFVSSFFSVLYYFGILQLFVRVLARAMKHVMGTSGAETLSVSANVFMGQTEAPLIVKPFVPRMTRSELLALMASGMAHISGGMMAVYISYGADPVTILCTCVMACPCSLYLTKLVLPEAGLPLTAGETPITVETPYVNAMDAAAAGVKDGLWLAMNVAAMLIAFIAFIALLDIILAAIKPGLKDAATSVWQMRGLYAVGVVMLAWGGRLAWRAAERGSSLRPGISWLIFGAGYLISVNFLLKAAADPTGESLAWWPDDLSLRKIFGWMFSPVAFLLGVDPAECDRVGTLLGIKLAANEHVAYLTLSGKMPDSVQFTELSLHAKKLTWFALTGFANFASVGIQLGGIGAIAPGRRADLAKLGMKALFVGFLATLINAAVAGLLM
jgi:concentrative nucleoside transporter, CNT family